ncbi:protein of unknown function [Serratia sp. Tan611]|nr:protein of unknown function [Serratia sp. Tan611]
MLTFGAHHGLPNKEPEPGAIGQGWPIEAAQAGMPVEPTRPATVTQRGHLRSRQNVPKRGRGCRGRAYGPCNCRSRKSQRNAGRLRQFRLHQTHRMEHKQQNHPRQGCTRRQWSAIC